MWHSRLNVKKIGTLVKTNHNWLKIVLALKIKKLYLAFLALKLGELPFFDIFFLDLAKFWDLDNFMFVNVPDFLANSLLLLISNLFTSPSPIPSYLEIDFFSDTVVFSIEVNTATILLKPYINW